MAQPWTKTDPTWASLNKYQRAAAIALMEADRMNPQSARNALGAIINRSAKSGVDLGEHVGQKIYQPTIEGAQQARLKKILNTSDFHNLTSWAERRSQGLEPDPVQGATHFLAPEKTMLALEASNPSKYKNWGPRGANWTGYDPSVGAYKGVITRDDSHAFLAPEGPYSVEAKVPPEGSIPAVAANIHTAGFGRESGPGYVAPEQSYASAAPAEPSPTGEASPSQSWLSSALKLTPGSTADKNLNKATTGFTQAAGAFGKSQGDEQDKFSAAERDRVAKESNLALGADDQRQKQVVASVLERNRERRKLAMNPRSAFGVG